MIKKTWIIPHKAAESFGWKFFGKFWCLKLYLHRLPAKAAKASDLHFWKKKLFTVEEHEKEKIICNSRHQSVSNWFMKNSFAVKYHFKTRSLCVYRRTAGRWSVSPITVRGEKVCLLWHVAASLAVCSARSASVLSPDKMLNVSACRTTWPASYRCKLLFKSYKYICPAGGAALIYAV